MRLINLAALITLGFAQCQVVTRESLRKKDIHLKNPPKTRTTRAFVDDFTILKDDEENFNSILNNILVVRVPDTPAIRRVGKYIANQMEGLGWEVRYDQFRDKTPVGDKQFTNIIATLNPGAPRRLVIACHYDSKLSPTGFLGATDSAVPCAQMINLATVMRRDLNDVHNRTSLGQDLTLQFLFFDGEEPFVRWSGNDNTYGSRHLAKVWQKKGLLDGIEVFMLLDLLGARNPKISPLDGKPHEWWKKLIEYENVVMDQDRSLPRSRIFRDKRPGRTGIEDDHIHFFRKNVPILHLIASPFPSVWHNMGDDRRAVHMPTVRKLNRILRLFVAHYLEL